jgi:hypothetical protein
MPTLSLLSDTVPSSLAERLTPERQQALAEAPRSQRVPARLVHDLQVIPIKKAAVGGGEAPSARRRTGFLPAASRRGLAAG